MNHFVENLSVNLKPSTREEFHCLYIELALPCSNTGNFDMAAHGPLLQDENIYYVIQRFDSLAQRERMEAAYYASDDWRQFSVGINGPMNSDSFMR